MIDLKNNYDNLFDITQATRSSDLKQLARQSEQAGRAIVAKQFESFFIDMLMQSMRKASTALGESDFLHSNNVDFYQDMYDQQLSLNMSKSGGLGLASLIEKQLQQVSDEKVEPAKTLNHLNDLKLKSRQVNKTDHQILESKKTNKTEVSKNMNQKSEIIDKLFSDPVNFVKSLWPDAVAASKQLHLDPKLLMAQAALETGWGQFIIRDRRGYSHNVFNIKATPDWFGKKALKDTVEFEHNQFVQRKDFFRSYDSFSESFQDYLSFLKNNPRYETALSSVHDPKLYLKHLQQSGYASDPHYADKIYKIYQSDMLKDAIQKMRLSDA